MNAERYITSKDVLEQAGISRATLNNYISQGLLPRPVVAPGDRKTSDAPRIGHFPESILDTIETITALKRQGLRLAEIAERLASSPESGPDAERVVARAMATRRTEARKAAPIETAAIAHQAPGYTPIQLDGPLRLTVEDLAHPAYMVNRRFELEWCNSRALDEFFGLPQGDGLADGRSLFRAFIQTGLTTRFEGWEELARFHLAVAKNFLSHEQLLAVAHGDDRFLARRMIQAYEEIEPAGAEGGVLGTEVNLAAPGHPAQWFKIYCSFFREGLFFTYAPLTEDQDSILTLLARRDLVIRDLLKKRRPHLTQLAVLTADLQGSCKICAELPPEEYFELINEVWSSMEPLLRRYYATHGKHVGDGMLYYFLPQPDSNYVMNAVRCGVEMREMMREIDDRWTRKKNWVNRLRLNIGIDEGQEWFGTYQTPTHLEFTALGDTINNASRLSDFATEGTIWVTKNVLGRLSGEERERLTFGVRRQGADGEEILVSSTFARIGNLVESRQISDIKYRDVAALPVTEVLEYRERR
ncbi:MAG: adenylate/guanylate cyclase domain-containing protein [Gammaproteobacteria bacterium]|nr:adenylate/guanylate cyclase domain-containing protein [Gammaproteobacteria bacterium]